MFFRSSNKWDSATDMLANKHKLDSMQKKHTRKKQKHKYITIAIHKLSKLTMNFLYIAKERNPIGKTKYMRQEKKDGKLANFDYLHMHIERDIT